MHVSIIGTNGLLSNSIAKYCNGKGIKLYMYGRRDPISYSYSSFNKVDLVNDSLNYDDLAKSDLIIYTAGAGIQSQLKEKADLIYHLNVTTPVSVCNNLKDLGFTGTFMSFGSYFEIGETEDNRSFTEIELLRSQFIAPNDYTISKRMLSRFFNSFRAPFTILHFILPTIYGENESNHRLIPYTLNSIDKNLKLTFTSGEQIRQYIYINDVVEILFNSIEKKLASGTYNIEGVEELSVKELIVMLFKLKEKSLPDDIFGKTERADAGMKVLKLNGEKLQKGIDYKPITKISEIYSKYKF